MNADKRSILMKTFFNTESSWLFCSCSINNKLSKLHEWLLCIVCSGTESSFEPPLQKDGSASMHVRYFQILATKMLTVSENLLFTLND